MTIHRIAKPALWTLALAVAAVLVIVYGSFDPATAPFPRCPFKMLTTFDCPRCGSQRAIHALLHADIAGAWRANAMMVIMLPIVAVLITAGMLRNKAPRFYNAVNSRTIAYSVLAATITWWIGRNIF